MAQSKFINPNWKKEAPAVVMQSVARVGGGVAASYAYKWLTSPKDPNDTASKPMLEPKFAGPALLIAGLAGEIFMNEPHLIALSEGMSTVGALKTIQHFAGPDTSAKLGLGAVTDKAVPTDRTLRADVMNLDFDKLLAEADQLANSPSALPGGVSGAEWEEGDGDDVPYLTRTSNVEGITAESVL